MLKISKYIDSETKIDSIIAKYVAVPATKVTLTGLQIRVERRVCALPLTPSPRLLGLEIPTISK